MSIATAQRSGRVSDAGQLQIARSNQRQSLVEAAVVVAETTDAATGSRLARQLAAAGFAAVGLGPRVLRADTAPVVAVAEFGHAAKSGYAVCARGDALKRDGQYWRSYGQRVGHVRRFAE